jgi:hypothetical protein
MENIWLMESMGLTKSRGIVTQIALAGTDFCAMLRKQKSQLGTI